MTLQVASRYAPKVYFHPSPAKRPFFTDEGGGGGGEALTLTTWGTPARQTTYTDGEVSGTRSRDGLSAWIACVHACRHAELEVH